MPPQDKQRLDLALLDRGLAPSRQRARAMIMAGKISVNNQRTDKPGASVTPADSIALIGEDIPYVSRGGLKLERALEAFDIRVEGYTCLDVGASTGGFTDCLLQHGAATVYAVDVGYGQFAWSLRNDPRIMLFERTNIRNLAIEKVPSPVDIAVIDVSFISLKIVVPVILKFLKTKATVAALIKPQFEVGKGKVGKGGVVKDPLQHQSVIDTLTAFFEQLNFTVQPVIPSPIKGPKGNTEFLIAMTYQ
ncbi:MAG: TlyA family RNA methyltransferase [Deltaproteobacteria bacterium]|nr:TlyA family RNA methyltransferase [Deltaproteobacteria bacterium]